MGFIGLMGFIGFIGCIVFLGIYGFTGVSLGVCKLDSSVFYVC